MRHRKRTANELLDMMGYGIETEKQINSVSVQIKRRSFLSRLYRLPKVVRVQWKATKEVPFCDRIQFIWTNIKIIML